MKTLIYHLVSLWLIVSGLFLCVLMLLGVYEAYKYWGWFVAIFPISVLIFVKSVRYILAHRIERRTVHNDRKKQSAKNVKLLRKMLGNISDN